MKEEIIIIDATLGISSIVSALHDRFPNLDKHQLQHLTNSYLSKSAEHIMLGEQAAFIRQNPDGTFQMTVISMGNQE